tara:strand:- start:2276 stop:2731 length:456 start_codon:yes stop_codon:yes gene_type:complete
MIISCEKCNKKFEISEKLIPESGRLLQCGSCSHQWHYKADQEKKIIDKVEEHELNIKKTNKVKTPINKKIIKHVNDKNINNKIEKEISQNKKNVSILNYLLVVIISLIAFIIFADTFKNQLTLIIPNMDFYLSSLYESLTDIFLFFKDLIK